MFSYFESGAFRFSARRAMIFMRVCTSLFGLCFLPEYCLPPYGRNPYITKLTKEKIGFRLCLTVVNLEVYYIFIYIIYYIYKYIIKYFYLLFETSQDLKKRDVFPKKTIVSFVM